MLEETIAKMEESSKRMRDVMAERVQKLKTHPRKLKHGMPTDLRNDEVFGINVAGCGGLNLSLRPSAVNRRYGCTKNPRRSDPENSDGVQRTVNKTIRNDQQNGVPRIVAYPVKSDLSIHSSMSVPDDEKEQDTKLKEDKKYDDIDLSQGHADIKRIMSISEELSKSIQQGFDLRGGVQCHAAIDTVASSE
jgi:hypothetical protein